MEILKRIINREPKPLSIPLIRNLDLRPDAVKAAERAPAVEVPIVQFTKKAR